ncbi:nitrite/sulfite reductase [Lentisphaerota bacterium WC36G]|nr:nitrite/sulfite reductase [Lentisphaerae bacterium WC36]
MENITSTPRESLSQDLENLYIAIEKYIAGEYAYKELKHYSAQFGIYQQRDKNFMVRLRVTGNRLKAEHLNFVRTQLLDQFSIDYCRLTTRQDIQLHGVKACDIKNIIELCNKSFFPFNGGGGDTFRNILVSEYSGLTKRSVFDVQPFVEKLWEKIGAWECAFHMPRKFKMGVFDGPHDLGLAKIQDLGLVAKVKNDEHGFEVYVGGGLGAKTAEGIRLFEFLPAEKVVRLIHAMLELFNDHGNRERRSLARLRYVKERLGDDDFRTLCLQYFQKSIVADNIKMVDSFGNYEPHQKACIESSIKTIGGDQDDFLRWKNLATHKTIYTPQLKAVKLFIKEGNLTSNQLEMLENIAKRYSFNNGEVAISYSQDIILPLVDANSLGELYDEIKQVCDIVDFDLTSFSGHIRCCVGANVCSIGILDSTTMSQKIAEALDDKYQDLLISNNVDDSQKVLRVCDTVLISGCPNCCARHVTAKIGLSGKKMRIDDEVVDAYKIVSKHDNLAVIAAQELGEFTVETAVKQVVDLIGKIVKK